jgi:hypothetical protein
VPDKTVKLNPSTQVFMYEFKPAGTGGVNVTLPLDLGGVTVGGSGSFCLADLSQQNSQQHRYECGYTHLRKKSRIAKRKYNTGGDHN